MKKILSMLLVLCLLLPMAAMAEVYEREGDAAYSITVPEGWMILTKETVESLIAVGSETVDETLKPYLDAVQSMDMAYFLAANMADNLSIAAQPVGMELTDDMFSGMIPVLQQQLKQQFDSMGVTITNEGETVTLGERAALCMGYSMDMSGISMEITQYMVPAGTSLLVITYTAAMDDDAERAKAEEMIQSLTFK